MLMCDLQYNALVKERQHHLHHHHDAAVNASFGTEQMELRV